MTDQTPNGSVTIALRVTAEQRAYLEREAGGMGLSAYLRWRLFASEAPTLKSRSQFPTKDRRSLGQALAYLGQLAAAMKALVKARDAGTLPLSEETDTAIRNAALAVLNIRKMLITALGLKDGGQ